MKLKIILLLTVIALSTLAIVKFTNRAINSEQRGLLDSEFKYVRATNSSADRFITTLKEQLSENPGNSKLMTSLGAAYIQKARETSEPEYYSLAEDILKRAIKADGKNFLALAELGSIHLSKHDFKEALELAKKALALNPYNSYSYGVLVDSKIELGMYEEAISDLQKMINIKPDLSSYSRVSYVRELHGDLDGAIDAMKAAIEAGSPLAENTAWCRIQLGNLYYNRGEISEAEKIFQLVINDFPEYCHGYGCLAKIKMKNKDYPGAIELYNKAIEKNSLPEFLIALGDAFILNGNSDLGEVQYDKVKSVSAKHHEHENGEHIDIELICFFADHNMDLKTLKSAARHELNHGSKSIKIYNALAWTEYKLGNINEAEKNINLALRLGSKDPLLSYHAGKIYQKAGQTDKANEHLKYALMINPFYEQLYSE